MNLLKLNFYAGAFQLIGISGLSARGNSFGCKIILNPNLLPQLARFEFSGIMMLNLSPTGFVHMFSVSLPLK